MKKLLCISLAILSIFLVSCSKKAAYESPVYRANTKIANFASKVAVSEEAVMADYDDYAMEKEVSASGQTLEVERKLIKNGSIQIEVENFDSVDDQIKAFVKKFGGYIVDTYNNENCYNTTIRIPSDKFEIAMDESGTLGKVKSRSENSQDVTDQYYDLESRIETKKILKEKFESYLKQATNMSDLLEVERQLNEVISELEAVEGRMKRLSNQIDFSTIYINCSLPYGHNNSGFEWPNIGEKFKELGYNTVSFLASLFVGIFYVLIFGIPLLAIIALVYWLCFGKVGLLVKLFKLLSKKKD